MSFEFNDIIDGVSWLISKKMNLEARILISYLLVHDELNERNML